jgi:hypothetical protein
MNSIMIDFQTGSKLVNELIPPKLGSAFLKGDAETDTRQNESSHISIIFPFTKKSPNHHASDPKPEHTESESHPSRVNY